MGIVGGGPSGLLLARLLRLSGVEAIVLERRTPDYLRTRVRTGLLEQGTVDLLTEAGVGERLTRERLVHAGLELAFEGKRHRIDLKGLSGKVVAIYGQAEIQKGPDGRARCHGQRGRLRGGGCQPSWPRKNDRACTTRRTLPQSKRVGRSLCNGSRARFTFMIEAKRFDQKRFCSRR